MWENTLKFEKEQDSEHHQMREMPEKAKNRVTCGRKNNREKDKRIRNANKKLECIKKKITYKIEESYWKKQFPNIWENPQVD